MSQAYRDALRQLAATGVPPDASIAAEMTVGLDGFAERWVTEILPFVQSGGTELRFIEGAYGRGKTHLLKYLAKKAEDRGFLTCYATCGTNSEPFESLEDTYRAIARNICWSANGDAVTGLPDILEKLDPSAIRAVQASRHIVASIRNVCRAYSRRRHEERLPDPIAADLRELLVGNSGHRVLFRDLYRRDHTLPRPMAKIGRRNASHWLRSLLSLPRALGLQGLIVFFDETGADLHLTRAAPLKQKRHMANLRNLIDHMAIGDTAGCAIVYAVTHDLIDLSRSQYPALAQRIERPRQNSMWTEREANPRAVWTNLDELTDPNPKSKQFFLLLGKQLAKLAVSAGMQSAKGAIAQDLISREATEAAESCQDDTVRIYVKTIASALLNLDRH